MDSPYRIPTRPVSAKLVVEGGRHESVFFYLSTVSETHAGAETVEEALNRRREFVPVGLAEGGKNLLIRRRAIERVTVASSEPDLFELSELAPCVDLVHLELRGGEIIEGTLATILPAEHPRLSDYFNLEHALFVPIAVDDAVTFVNRDFISIVRL